jgi:transposase-like protein
MPSEITVYEAHQRYRPAKGRNHINGIEGFWEYAKTRLFRFRGMATSTFNVHLKECGLDSITEVRISAI